jgi:hypothetical protein
VERRTIGAIDSVCGGLRPLLLLLLLPALDMFSVIPAGSGPSNAAAGSLSSSVSAAGAGAGAASWLLSGAAAGAVMAGCVMIPPVDTLLVRVYFALSDAPADFLSHPVCANVYL